MARALATPITPRFARYDVILLAGLPHHAERDARIAAEFARHEHRVFHLAGHHDANGRSAPTLHRIALPIAQFATGTEVVETLRNLRRAEGIEAAVLFAPQALDPDIVGWMRQLWGWRIATISDALDRSPAFADVKFRFEAVDDEPTETAEVTLAKAASWPARWSEMDRAIRASWPRASLVVVTHDNLAFNRMCLASILENTDYPNYEVIVVDNASTDGTVEEIRRLANEAPNVRVILNAHNAGLGVGYNQGLAAASGDVLVLLNNDIIVPWGWLTRLARHLEHPRVGLIGPGTNRTCNEAQLDIPYQTYAEFQAVARALAERHEGDRFSIRMPMMFCTAFRRDTYERLGPLDERYEIGMFEDEDYALRAKQAGLETVWTPEVYVHHAYHASIGKLLPSGEYMRLVKLNQGRFEEKWGICWERHRPAPHPAPGT